MNAQNTFNKSITLGYPYTNFTGITINDTSVFCAGIYVDSITPFAQGAFLYEMDMQGEMLKEYAIADSTGLRHTWEPKLTWLNDSTLLNIGYFQAPGEWSKSMVLEYDVKNKEIQLEKYISNPPRGMLAKDFIKGFDGNFMLAVNNGEFFSSFVALDSVYEIKSSEYINSNSFRAFFSRSMAKGNGKYYIASVRSNLNTADRGFVIQNIITVFDSTDQKVTEYQTPGNELWESPESILVTDDGGILVTSKTGREILDGRFGLLLLDPTVYKLKEDSTTNQLVRDWTLTFSNGWEHDAGFLKRISKIIPTENKKEFLAIGSRFINPIGLENPDEAIKSFMVKFTDDGDSLWTREYEYLTDGSRFHELNDIIAAPDGGYYLCGLISDFRDSISAEAPYRRGWLMKVDEHGCLIPGCEKTSSISEQSDIVELKLYPNPADDFINFQVVGFSKKSNFNCRIVDLQGRTLKTFDQLSSNITYFYPIKDLSNGIYILQILDTNGIVASKKLVVN